MELLPDYNEKFNISVYYHNNKPAYIEVYVKLPNGETITKRKELQL